MGDQDCIVCGERRLPASPYCPSCFAIRCPDCGIVHDTRGGKCDPPPEEPS